MYVAIYEVSPSLMGATLINVKRETMVPPNYARIAHGVERSILFLANIR